MTIQQKLANRIYEILPHKKELDLGCIFWIYSGDHKKKLYCQMVSKTHYDLKEYTTSNHYIWEIKKEQIVSSGGEIIGQPIRLADVLFIFEDKYKKAGIYTKETYYKTFGDIIARYNLSKDNLLDQSDEFCEYLYELIK